MMRLMHEKTDLTVVGVAPALVLWGAMLGNKCGAAVLAVEPRLSRSPEGKNIVGLESKTFEACPASSDGSSNLGSGGCEKCVAEMRT